MKTTRILLAPSVLSAAIAAGPGEPSPVGVALAAAQIAIEGEIAIGVIETAYYKAALKIGRDEASNAARLDDVAKRLADSALTLIAVLGGGGEAPAAMVRDNGRSVVVPVGKRLPDGRTLLSAHPAKCGVVARSIGGVEEAVYIARADVLCGGRTIAVKAPTPPVAAPSVDQVPSGNKPEGKASDIASRSALSTLPSATRDAVEKHPGCVTALKGLPPIPDEPALTQSTEENLAAGRAALGSNDNAPRGNRNSATGGAFVCLVRT